MKNDWRNFRSKRKEIFLKKVKKSKNGCFCQFRANCGYLSHIPAIRSQYHCTIGTPRVTAENFVRIVRRVFGKIAESRKMKVFLAYFGLILAMFLTFRSEDFEAIAQIGL